MDTTIIADMNAKPGPDGPTAIGFGGARGGGKSFWLLAQMAGDLDEESIGGDDSADTLPHLVSSKAREIHVVKLRGL